ncbi:uncharacterized protein LOC134263022 [Saccostrea cucullata]|uniref:uncharacterized protein LOC134263022 n=1 Tax=Saccostrea cuccullata TaxID=36930 RepID=UPI002ED51BB9
MDPRTSAQELLLCDLCQTAALQSHCELCQINLCKACVGDHLSDSSKRHNVVPYKHRTFSDFPKCQNHSKKQCELYCKKCDIPVCTTCISSGKHTGHDLLDMRKFISSKTEELGRDLTELEKEFNPVYEKIASDLKTEKAHVVGHFEKLTTTITQQGEDWHREINIIVNKRKSEIGEMKEKYLASLNEEEEKIMEITSDLNESILEMKKILDANDVSRTSAYKSRNDEFRSLPPKINISLPSFFPHQINREQLYQSFCSVSALPITSVPRGYILKTKEAVSCPSPKPMLDEPEIITTIDTRYNPLFSVTCLSDEEIWTCWNTDIINSYNKEGKVLKLVQTSMRIGDIAVTNSGDLVYTNDITRTVNIVKNSQIQELIRLQEWIPYYVCVTSTADLLVTMLSNEKRSIVDKQSRVVRYSDSNIEKQSIQFDDKNDPLFSYHHLKNISENRNQDICVADYKAKSVVVVNKAGTLRFRYNGHPYNQSGPFKPQSITTDSQSQILIINNNDNCIHILDQDGQFLRYIDNCDLKRPWGLCVDKKDNLYVAEFLSGKVKQIKYM